MSPTFETGHYLLVERLSFSLSEPKRGEVVVFDIPDKGLKASGHEKTCYIKNEGGSRFNKFLDNFASDKDCFWKSSRYLIKRLVGLPGDKVVVLNGVTTIYNSQNPNGFILNEKYVENENINVSSSVNLGPDEYFVMGDNRQNSSDGRYWGYVPRENLLGRPLVRLFPPSLFGFYPGDTDYK
jgi:signal peptidase I